MRPEGPGLIVAPEPYVHQTVLCIVRPNSSIMRCRMSVRHHCAKGGRLLLIFRQSRRRRT
jgi:hypothetical protein